MEIIIITSVIRTIMKINSLETLRIIIDGMKKLWKIWTLLQLFWTTKKIVFLISLILKK